MKKLLRRVPVAILTWEARLALNRHRPKIIAITGNLGKTTTKDAIFAAVSPHFNARKSEKSFNSDIGVPLAILGLPNAWSNPFRWILILTRGLGRAFARSFPELLVLEVGADHPGDIAAITRWLTPDIAVYTGVPEIPVHIAYFGSRKKLIQEKQVLLTAVKNGGTVIANYESGGEEALEGLTAKVIGYGLDAACEVRATDMRVIMENNLPIGMEGNAVIGDVQIPLRVIGALGTPVIRSALAALATAQALGIPPHDAAKAILAWHPAPGRMRVLPGKNGAVVIDDSYNSSPAAAVSALDTLREIPGTRRIAVLGDMRELGEWSERGHRLVGEHAAKIADLLITIGEESRVLARAAREVGMPPERIREYGYGEAERVGRELAHEVQGGDIVLVKGSQNKIRLEKAVHELLADPKEAEALLVRHEAAWRKR